MKRDETTARLRQLILTRYAPGQPLSEQELAHVLGVSRTPVREALLRLEKDGLVTMVPRRGPFVTVLTVQDIHELFEVREALELYAVRRAAELVDAQVLERIEKEAAEIYRSLRAEDSPERKFQAMSDVFNRLHRLILTTRRNSRFLALLEMVRGTWYFARQLMMTQLTEDEVVKTYEEHCEILAALRARDPQRAERAMQVHLENSRRRFLVAVPQEPSAAGQGTGAGGRRGRVDRGAK
jgi:DNA-binding GntR family transcriptional regulator